MHLEGPGIESARRVLSGSGRCWFTGGTVRDLLLGIVPRDIDIVVDGDPEAAARRLASETGSAFVPLSESFQTFRVVAQARDLTFDFTALRGGDIEEDLRQRDFTADALALPLAGDGTGDSSLVDPCGGRRDLERRRLEAVSPGIFEEDPLRLLRALRLEKSRGLALSPSLVALVRGHAALADRPAAERIFAELEPLLALPGTAAAARRLHQLGLLPVLLPEIAALEGVKQNRYHHLDVLGHTLAHAEALEQTCSKPEEIFPEAAAFIRSRARARIAGDAGWGFVMGFTSLAHDVAKPACTVEAVGGEIRFLEHDRKGADMAAAILSRFRASRRCRRAVAFLVARHMRFEGLIQSTGPSLRARRRYLAATRPMTPELVLLSAADRLSSRGPLVSQADIERHLELAREVMNMSIESLRSPPARLVNGEELMRELELEPGPLVGELLRFLEEKQALGDITTREQALVAASAYLESRNRGKDRPRRPSTAPENAG